jgi:uncharacterized protein (TIGR03790 family)
VTRTVEVSKRRATQHWRGLGLLCLLVFVPGVAHDAFAQDGSNVLLVVNTANAASAPIAARYVRTRGVPAEQVVRVTTATGDEIERGQYERQIERPIADWITSHDAQDRILYIVLIKGIPLRIAGTPGRQGTVASVDSELTLLYRRLVGARVLTTGPVGNSYFHGARSLSEIKPFNHADHDLYLVSRLDGFTEQDVNGLISRGASPVRTGSFLLDGTGPATAGVTAKWLQATADALVAGGFQGRVGLDTTPAAAPLRKNVLGYVSGGSNDPSLNRRRLGIGFAPGALATLLVSTDARTVSEPPDTWQPGSSVEREALFRGSSQSLAADLIRDGVTGASGYVAEPFLAGTVRPDILFPAYVEGANLVEAFYLAMPSLSWQNVVFGDPLCAPFRKRLLLPDEKQPPIDPQTELPVHFSQRRVAQATAAGLSGDGVKLMLKGEGRRRHGDTAAAKQALEEATKLEPRLTSAHRLLAAIYEEQGQPDLAIERYRRVLADAPDDLLSLNNLAYALAVHAKAPQDALAPAQKAYELSKGAVPSITDTLGWVHFLLGQHAEAEKYLSEAATAAPNNADVQLHLAHVYAARGRADLAAKAIARCVQLDPTSAERADVKELRAKLGTR